MIDPATDPPSRPYRSGAAPLADLTTQVHIWHVDLDACPRHGRDSLSEDERVRASRFARPLDSHRFVAGRSTLRAILADILGLDYAGGRALRFAYGLAGKPILIDDPGLCFNVSHAEGQAVIAATRAGAVGIDIERQRRLAEMEGVARLLFTAGERDTLISSPPDAREAVFTRIWTCKEALVKAMGTGVAALRDPDAVTEAGALWRVSTLPAPVGYVVALAWPRDALALRSWSWPGALADEASPAPGDAVAAGRAGMSSR